MSIHRWPCPPLRLSTRYEEIRDPSGDGEGRRQSHVAVDGLRLHVIEWGRLDARPLVVLHGLRESGLTFASLAQALAPEFRVIALDQRGRGRSDWGAANAYHLSRYVADLAAVVDALGLGPFDLLGHSMGGANALTYAAAYPQQVRRLVIEDTAPGAAESSPMAGRLREELAHGPHAFASRDAVLAYLRGLRPGGEEPALEQRLDMLFKPCGDGYVWRYDVAGVAAARLSFGERQVGQVDLVSAVARLQCPTLLLRGAQSDYLSAEAAAAMLALNTRIRLVEIAGATHYVHEDAPEAYAAAVRGFLNQPDPVSDLESGRASGL